MSDELTLNQVRAASQFNAELCAPVAYYLQAFHEKLPAQDELILSGFLSVEPIYLEPKSQLTRYLHQTLLKFKRMFPKDVRSDLIARHYDPALTFFKKSMERGSAVLINCRNLGVKLSGRPMLMPLGYRNEREGVLKSLLQKRFGYKFKEGVESWLKHRIFYNELRNSNDLILVVTETHDDTWGAHDQMLLFDRLSKRKDYVDLRVALEMNPEEFKKGRDRLSQNSKSFRSWLANRGEGAGAAELYEALGSREMILKTCRLNNLDSVDCFQGLIPSLKRDIMLYFMGDERRFWAVDDEALKIDSFQALRRTIDKMNEAEILNMHNNLTTKARMRTDVMARNLVRNMQQEGAGKPRIIVFSTGSDHTLDVIRYLRKNTKASIIGLMPTRYYRLLDEVAKLPEVK